MGVIRTSERISDQMLSAKKRLARLSSRQIPPDLDYSGISGLSREMCEKLSRARPRDLGMAGRIPGVTPAAVSILSVQLELRKGRSRQPAS
jgi:tRNA uridine 5-carboxymethylaminomethyl modification enzyme